MAADPLIGFVTDAVRFERLLGKGAMGAVYQGIQLGLERPVAIKVIAAHLMEDPGYIARFEREAQTVGKLLHPNIIACHDFGPTTGPHGETIYLMVLEFVDGWSLGDLLRSKRLTVRQVLELHRQAAEGLAAAHRVGIVHRDIKPDNIMVTRKGQAKLADFGLARQLSQDSELTAVGTILGSPAFMSPETCQGLEPTPESDTYSLGCSLMQTLTGTAVFPGGSALKVMQDHIAAPIPRLADRRRELEPLQGLIDRSLAKDPAHRYRDVQLFAQDLAKAAPTMPRDLFAGNLGASGPGKVPGGLQSQIQLGQSSMLATISTNHIRTRTRPKRVLFGLIAAGLMVVILACVAISSLHGPSAASLPTGATALADAPRNPPASGPAPAPAANVTSQAPQTSPPVPVSPAPSVQEELDPTDSATLDQAEALIKSGKLDEAQALMVDLVVAGDLKARRKSLMDLINAAWDNDAKDLTTQLQAASDSLGKDPQGTCRRLEALVVPAHFPELETRRQELLSQGAKLMHLPSSPRPIVVANAPTTSLPTSSNNTLITLLHQQHFTNIAKLDAPLIPRGDPRLPGFEPWGPQNFISSIRVPAHNPTRQMIIMHLPGNPGPAHDGLLLVLRAPKAETLLVTRRQSGERYAKVASLPLNGTDWQTYSMDLGPASPKDRYISVMAVGAADAQEPFFLAAAAIGTGVIPTYSQLQLIPGTLMDDPMLQEAFDIVHLKERDFPHYDRIALGLPKHPYEERPELARGLSASVQDGFGLTGAPTANDNGHTLPMSFYGALTHQGQAVSRTGGRRMDFYLHVVSTSRAPEILPTLLGEPFMHALQDGLMPVLVLGPEDWQDAAVHASWLHFVQLLRQQVSGLPVIDLAQVPLMYQQQHSPIDINSDDGMRLVDQGLGAGVHELRARIDFILGRP